MVTKKIPTLQPTFQFKKKWIFDEVPPWVRLDRATLARIEKLKDDFTKQVNEQLKNAQR